LAHTDSTKELRLSLHEVDLRSERFLESGDESGTAPGDRPFRPDVEGLRAVAVLLVVLFHSGVSAISGGFIGVDVFFVISGFVITGVLLRERASTGSTSLLAFYGRRCRRIIPAATLVIIVTVFLSYFFLSSVEGSRTATDGLWAAVFLANVHFVATGTNYLGSQLPPSPLQNFWSLAVEEQFYVVYPTLFLLLAGIRARVSLRLRLAILLILVIAASLVFSVLDTSNNATGAYFSPFTRAWELALGALVAVATPWLVKLPVRLCAIMTWVGLGAILGTAFVFTSHTAYPGSLVSIPVVGAALIIAGGMRTSRFGVETILGLAPLRALGRLSYSLYLWHWPILILAAEHGAQSSPSFPQSLGWVLLALAASALTYYLVENPIRHAKTLFRVRWASLGLGAALVALTLGVVTLQSDVALGAGIGRPPPSPQTSSTPGLGVPLRTVLQLVAASDHIRTLPRHLVPSLSEALLQPYTNWGGPGPCVAAWQHRPPGCTFGDHAGRFTMVLYGDSHADQWFKALDDIATRAHWKLLVFADGGCPPSAFPDAPPGAYGDRVDCYYFNRFAISTINRVHPSLLVITQALNGNVTTQEWRHGLEQVVKRITVPKPAQLILGDTPILGRPSCLPQHVTNVQGCSTKRFASFESHYDVAERQAAAAEGARYISVTPWFCASRCSPVIGNFDVYFNFGHVAVGYTRFLEGVLTNALNLPSYERSGSRL
jgi:peptidoglycan/LPS O-acetylase OafA/YrhL